MSIHLARDGSALGVFSEAEVREGLASGRFRHDDLAWREGMPAWVALASWPEFATIGGPSGFAPDAPSGPAMPAWERGASFASFFETIRDVAIDPIRTFDALPREGLGKPLAYNYAAMLPALLCGAVGYGLLISIVGAATLFGQNTELTEGLADGGFGATYMGFIICCLAATLPVLSFVGAGFTHLLLLPWGPKGGYVMTYRASAYATGAFMPFAFIPCLNYVSGPWSMVSQVIGLSRVHRMDWWKVVLSIIVVPCLLACCLVWLAIAAGGMAASGR